MIVASGDDELYHQFQGTEWHVPAHIYSFVEDMPTLMHAADCFADNAVGLIATESLACDLLVLLIALLKHHAIIGKGGHCHAAQKSC